jgi:hypothetical protein
MVILSGFQKRVQLEVDLFMPLFCVSLYCDAIDAVIGGGGKTLREM